MLCYYRALELSRMSSADSARRGDPVNDSDIEQSARAAHNTQCARSGRTCVPSELLYYAREGFIKFSMPF